MEASVQQATRGFTREAVEELSRARQEPDWLLQRRLEAWAQFESIPMPVRTDEEWRRTDIRRLPINQVEPIIAALAPVAGELPAELASRIGERGQRAGLLVQRDGATIYHELNDELASQGVIFMDIERAVREHSELIQRYFMTDCVAPGDNKFAALNGAFWSGGALLYVPAGVQIEHPLRTLVNAATPGSGIFPHTLLVAEEGAKVTLVETWASPTSEQPVLAAPVVEIFAGEATEVRYVQFQDWGRQVWNFANQRALVQQDAQMNSLNVSLGARLSKSFITDALVGAGAQGEMLGLFFADETQHLDHTTRQMHVSPYASSDLLFKGALKDRARTVYSGLIKVFPGAQRTDAYQANRNLVLSRTARADTIPNLEIGANDVRCTHGATVGQVEEEYIFYLMSRGINRTEAVKLIVDGFFDEVIERVPVPEVQDEVRAAIARKIGL